MKFKTQFDYPKKSKFEETGSTTLVTKVSCLSNTERIAQMMLTGQYLEADKIGYEYGPEDKIPENLYPRPDRRADVTQLLEHIQNFGARLRERIQNYNQKKADEAAAIVAQNAREGGKDARTLESDSKTP